MTYSCNTAKREIVVQLKTISFPGFDSINVCRFDQRYTEEHQALGCKGCTKEWDHAYLRRQGLLK